ncbi:DUF6378 domain-containing protein [Suttonella ornithocola]|uniref:DUF6378 domain-containing protein n=1 Tax=Suttonella ornithocola TaxID=279832 RepID=A0A380MU22_9GAMM|nr:DUF6378 domain-containing protein [Suttonella ornithocola]SUO95221.1 Uncharacterised protein [Suttonella ornithocola]
MTKADKLEISTVLQERSSRYGKFSTHARLAQRLKIVMRGGNSWSRMSDVQQEALEMIAHKIARILNGDPNYDDSWIDIAGYAQLVADELSRKARKLQTTSDELSGAGELE